MNPCEPHFWLWKILAVAWACLEFWLGRTDKVRAGSVLEAIMLGLRYIAAILILGFLLIYVGVVSKKSENENGK